MTKSYNTKKRKLNDSSTSTNANKENIDTSNKLVSNKNILSVHDNIIEMINKCNDNNNNTANNKIKENNDYSINVNNNNSIDNEKKCYLWNIQLFPSFFKETYNDIKNNLEQHSKIFLKNNLDESDSIEYKKKIQLKIIKHHENLIKTKLEWISYYNMELYRYWKLLGIYIGYK